jgi:enoyl-CoA hydratase/carnithine racemase
MIKKPMVAAISGYAVAGGMELALMCDLRVMEETAVMGVFCRRFGEITFCCLYVINYFSLMLGCHHS